MRITNSMITDQSIRNINKTKEQTSKLNDQMTSQKKITKPSDDPVIAIRSLRLRNSQAQINQYYENNIPDANSWLENSETALKNIKISVSEVYEQCVSGANDTLEISQRKIILDSLTSLRDDIYSEGNAEYSDRTLFTGFKTGSTLCFMGEDSDATTTYKITEKFNYEEMESNRYYANQVEIPDDILQETVPGTRDFSGETAIPQTDQVNQYRIRLAYDGIDDVNADGTMKKAGQAMAVKFDTAITIGGNQVDSIQPTVMHYDDWQNSGFTVGDDEVYLIQETGEMVFGKNVAEQIRTVKPEISVTYEKTGFKEGEVKPEYYFDCVDESDANVADWVTYEKQNQEIKYTIANNTTLTVNIQADSIYSTDIGRDIDEMITACDLSIKAQEKVNKIQSMIDSDEYANDEEAQAYLKNLLATAEKEKSFADDNMQKLFNSAIGNFQSYLDKVSDAITDVGNKMTRLELVKDRMAATSTDIKTLISSNEDMDLSEIVINYTAAYNAYEAALSAASKASERTLLDYI